MKKGKKDGNPSALVGVIVEAEPRLAAEFSDCPPEVSNAELILFEDEEKITPSNNPFEV